MKKFLALLLALCMVLSMVACGGNTTETTPADDNQGDVAGDVVNDTYTYNTYAAALATNWNPHTWEMNTDSTVMGYIEAPLTDITIKDSAAGEYQWIFVAATDIQDVTADHQDDLVKYGAAETDATEGYVYEIKLREGMVWQDGTPINADTYIYSMKQMLDPAMQNYRANNYYSGESAIAGAYDYFYQGQTVVKDNSAAGTIASLDDLVKGEDGNYTMPDGSPVWFCVGIAGEYVGMSMVEADAAYADEYGYDVFEDTALASLAALADEEGKVPVNEETWALIGTAINMPDWGNEDETCIPSYIAYEATYAECDYDSTVGLYKVDDYTIRYVCATAYDYYYFLTSCTSNWIVHEEMYESCKTTDEATGLVSSNYNTSVETTMAYGPYKLVSLEDAKQMVFEQNETYWEYTTDENGNLVSETFFEVDGATQAQYITQKIVIDVMTDDAAKLAFLSGELDDWALSAEDAVTYSTSEQLYKVDETYTMRLFFNTGLDALKAMDADGTNINGVVMSNENFRRAFSLAIERDEFVTATAGFKPACFLINSLYYYNVYEDPASIYRNTDEAKQAVLNIYGIEYGEGTPYADIDAAYESVTGYNLTEAQELMKLACDELVAEGLYTAGEDIKITIALTAGAADATDQQQMSLLNKYINAAAEGSGFGKIELAYVDNLNDRYKDVANGVYAIGRGAWGGAAFYPYTMMRVYLDPSYTSIHEIGCWDPSTEELTLTIDGEEVTMTWQEWSVSMTGTGDYANSPDSTKLQVLAGMEENFIEKYYCIPLCTYTACTMLSYKLGYFTENYSIMYGFGGMRLLQYNYSDAEWATFVADSNGTIGY